MRPEDIKYIILPAVLIIILGFCVYANSLDGEFIWDDDNLVKDNLFIRDLSNVPKLFMKNIRGGLGKRDSCSFRPLQTLSYMLDYSLWGLDVKGYHLTNLLLHIFVALSIYSFINILYSDRLLSFITGLLFLVHPVHTEAVTYISGRADSLAALFMLLCFIFYIKYIHSYRKIFCALAILSYICAIFSRENSLILPVLLLLYHYSFKKRLKINLFLPIAGLAIGYILLRLTVLKSLLPHASSSTTLLERIPGVFVAITDYIRIIFLPFNLHMEYGDKLFSLTYPKALFGIIILIFLLTYALKKRRAKSLFFFSISWFFIALLPSSNIYPIKAYMAEHWLYLPSVGFFLILAKAWGELYANRNLKIAAVVSVIAVVAFYSYLTIRQNEYWQEPIPFYERTLHYAPDSARVHNNLGFVYHNLGREKEAVALYKKAIEIEPTYATAYYNLGFTYYNMDKNQKAITLYKKAIEADPYYGSAYNNLGTAYSAIGKTEKALASYRKAIKLDPYYSNAYNNLGNAYYSIGRSQEAIAAYKKAIEISPSYSTPHSNLSMVYFYQKQYELAIQHCDKAIGLGHKISPEFLRLLKPHRKKSFK